MFRIFGYLDTFLSELRLLFPIYYQHRWVHSEALPEKRRKDSILPGTRKERGECKECWGQPPTSPCPVSARSLGQSMASGVGEDGELAGRVTVLFSSTAIYSVYVKLGSTTTPVCLCSCLKLRHCHVTLNVLIVSICRREQPMESRFLFSAAYK